MVSVDNGDYIMYDDHIAAIAAKDALIEAAIRNTNIAIEKEQNFANSLMAEIAAIKAKLSLLQ